MSVSVRCGGYGAQHHGDLAAAGPAERARPGEDRLVGLGAEHGVDDQGLEARVPRAADLGGAGVDLGGREGDLAAVEQHRAVHVVGVLGGEEVVDVRLHHLDAEPDQGHRLLEVDHARQGAGRGAEDGRRQRRAAREPGLAVRYQSTKPRMPACTIRPTHERSSAESSRNQGMSCSMRAIAAVLSAPVARCSASAAPIGVAARRAEGGRHPPRVVKAAGAATVRSRNGTQ